MDLTRIPVPTFKGVCFSSLLKHGKGAWGTGDRIDWVIVGGESGAGSRPFDVGWATHIIGQCQGAKVSVFVKQLGAVPRLMFGGPEWKLADWPKDTAYSTGPDGITLRLRDKKGGDWSEWDDALHVRQFPEVVA